MSNSQQKSFKPGDKVKLKLEQPLIICAGRKAITFITRGRVLEGAATNELVAVLFKSHGTEVIVHFDVKKMVCLTTGWIDLKIV